MEFLSNAPNAVRGQVRRNNRNNSSASACSSTRQLACSHFGCKGKPLALWVRGQNHLLAAGPMPARDHCGVAPPSRTDPAAVGDQTAARAQLDRPPGTGRTAPRCCGVLLAVQSVWSRPREDRCRADASPCENRGWTKEVNAAIAVNFSSTQRSSNPVADPRSRPSRKRTCRVQGRELPTRIRNPFNNSSNTCRYWLQYHLQVPCVRK